MRNRILQHLGVLATGETPATADQVFIDEAIDAAHDRLRTFGMVPFPTSAFPSWAQTQFRNMVAGDVAVTYGMSGQRLLEFQQAGSTAWRELARQVAGYRHPVPIRAKYF